MNFLLPVVRGKDGERGEAMTNEEAIKCIEDVLGSDFHYDDCQLTSDDFEWLEEAKEALEKQTQKKITHTATLKTSCTCPNCGNCLDKFEKFGESIVRVKYQYCHFCGQALDWSDEK